MQLLSYRFVLLWVITFALYYLVPQKRKWHILLVAGLVFYVIGLRGFPVSLLITCATTYACGIYLKKSLLSQKEALVNCADKETKKRIRQGFEKRRKLVQILYFALNLGLLVFYKYTVAALPFIKGWGISTGFFEKVIMPLGISFYTLTAISYVVDVGREQCEAEENPLKVLLFLSYFPAVTQGPFNRFARLHEEFEREHVFDYDRIREVSLRWLWCFICYSYMRIFPAIWIWRWGSVRLLILSCPRTLSVHIFPGLWQSFGAGGILPWAHGLRTM